MTPDVEQQKSQPKAKVFVSYSRKDRAFAERLGDALKARGLDPLIDREEIHALEEWWRRIETLIAGADTVVFVISPDSIVSDIAIKEVTFAASLNKRFAPIVRRRVEEKTVPEPLAKLNFVFFENDAEFEKSADLLADALKTDITWIRQHTHFGEHARDWARAKGPKGLLLRSPLLEQAERWIASRPTGAPAPTEETRVFIRQSRQAATRQRNTLTGSLAAGLILALALAVIAYRQRNVAVEQKDLAEAQGRIAESRRKEAEEQRNQALTTQSRFLADLSRQRFEALDDVTAALLALEGLPDDRSGKSRPFVPQAQLGLDNAWRHQHPQPAPQETQILSGHSSGVISCAFSSDGTLAATGSADRTTKVWNVKTGAEQLSFPEQPTPAYRVIFSADGGRVATAAEDGVRVWDVRSGHQVAFLHTPLGFVARLALSHDGLRVLSASENNLLQLWEVDSGRELHRFQGDDVLAVRIGWEGARSLVASATTVILYDAENDIQLDTFEGHKGKVIAGSFSSDGKHIATLDYGTVRVWRVDGGEPRNQQIASFSENGLGDNAAYRTPGVALNSDGSRLIAMTPSGYVLYNVDDQKRLADLEDQEVHQEPMFSPDGSFIVTFSENAGDAPPTTTARVWDGSSGQPISTLRHSREVECVDINSESNKILTGSQDRLAHIWSFERNPDHAGQSVAVLRDHEKAISGVEFSLDSRELLTYSEDATTRVWNSGTGNLISVLKGHTGKITGAHFENGGRRVLTRSEDNTVRVWNIDSGQEVFALRGHSGRIWSSRFNKSGSIIITASEDKTVRVWNGQDGSAIRVADFSPGVPIALSDETDAGSRVIVSQGDGSFELWSAETGQFLRQLEHKGKLKFYDLSNTVFVAVSVDNTIRLWNLDTGSELSVIQEPGPDLRSIDLSEDGARLTTVHGPQSYDKQATIKLWDTHNGKQVSQFDGHVRPMTAFSLSSDGSRLYTSTIDTNKLVDTVRGKVLLFEDDDHAASAIYNAQGTILASNQSRKVRILDAASGASLAILVHSGGPNSEDRLAFNGDGTRLVRTDGNSATLWRIAPTMQALIDAVRASIPRCLSREERIEAFLDPEPPAWCIEMEKWPYHTRFWKEWLTYKRANANPPLPDTPEWKQWVAARREQ